MRRDGVVTWLHADHLGSASVATNSSGGIVEQQRYTPFGSGRLPAPNMPTDRQFTGYVREKANYVGSLDFAQARYYSPYLGRFVSADTLVQAPGDPQTLNRYAYTRNNPLRYVDPSGHCFEPATAVLCVGGAVFLYAMLASQATLNHTYQSNPQVIEDLTRALSFPTDAGPSPTTNTAGTAARVQQPLVLADLNVPVAGVRTVESFPVGGEAAPLVLTTPLGGSSTLSVRA